MWTRAPWAATFDLLSAEYGWTDQQILDLTLPRIQQARDVILARRDRDYVDQASLFEATTRQIAATVAEYAMGSKKGAGAKVAKDIQFVKRQPQQQRRRAAPSVSSAMSVFGEPLIPSETAA